ncbi:MAG TPA: IPT/TIG domain-containing protein, partial [Burkholderiales bacterium]|nr:IPT/TIG domain-containing protein [Burkholderiales bacterium]
MDARLPLSRLAPALLMLIAMGAQADSATMGQVDLVAGRTLTLALDAAATRNLTSAAIMTTESGRLAQAPGMRATLGPARDGVRWLRISASATAATRQYQIHGVAGRNFGGVVPLAVRVVAPTRAGTPVSRSTQWSAETATVGDAANIRNARPFRALTSRLASLGRDLPAVTVDLGSFGGTVPPPGSNNVYRPDVVRVVTAPNTQVTGVAPVGTATVGSELVISGQYLPADAVIRIGGTTLTLLSVTPTKIRARLPQTPVTGPLILVWPSGGQEAVLDDSYVVTGTPTPAAFASFEPLAAGQNYKNAYLLSLLSWLAYADRDVAVTQAAAWGLTIGSNGVIDVDTPYFAGMSGNTQALILSNANTVFLAFRGSTDEDFFQDWLDNDLDLAPQPAGHWGSGVVLHHGFAEAMAIAYPAVKAR